MISERGASRGFNPGSPVMGVCTLIIASRGNWTCGEAVRGRRMVKRVTSLIQRD